MPRAEKPAKGRLGDILRPILEVIRQAAPERQEAILGLVADIQEGRLSDRADSLDARIILTVLGLQAEVSQSRLAVRTIADRLNENRQNQEQISLHRIGRRLTALGFTRGRSALGAFIANDKSLIERLVDDHGLRNSTQTSLSTQGEELPQPNRADCDDSELFPDHPRGND